MIKLIIDAKNKRIIVKFPENGTPHPFKHDFDTVKDDPVHFHLSDDDYLCEAEFLDISFEGFVLELIDKDGNSFLTEIPGLAN